MLLHRAILEYAAHPSATFWATFLMLKINFPLEGKIVDGNPTHKLFYRETLNRLNNFTDGMRPLHRDICHTAAGFT